ncbi:hypothetical protein [Paenibacillus sp. DYY-L-2]|uniref:hypothetical protein n=1 Tax=Paenibacillus sp. DYY-L-2 TaxID=3447013 RepID=UPI003F4FF143
MRIFECFRLKRKVNELALTVEKLNSRFDEMDRDLISGIFENPLLRQFLEAKVGQKLTVSTASSTVEGVIVSVADDAVEIREPTGHLVIAPYSRITVLQ